jgi:hypothetical protein
VSSDAERVTVEADLDAVQRLFEERHWSDGLPIIPPTPERVDAMVAAVRDERGHSLGPIPPKGGEATIENLAVNAVMAGCVPAAFPVVVAAVRAMLHHEFDLYGIQPTTHPVSPLVVVHGPIARKLKVNGGVGVLGPGFPANATIGRAIRLILQNTGGAFPGEADMATHGGPAKFTYCMTENMAESPWPEFHTTRGFEPDESAVTVFAGEAPHNVNDHESKTAVRLLDIVADVMRALGHNDWWVAEGGRCDVAVVLSPEHVKVVSGEGWTRLDVQRYLFETARRTVRDLMGGGMWGSKDWPAWMTGLADKPDSLIPLVRSADDIHVLVAGGAGKHSLVIPGYGAAQAVTVSVP